MSTKCVTAGVPAGVIVCVLFSAAGAAWGQEGTPSPDAVAAEPAAAASEESTALPKVVVTTPKEKKKKSTKKVSGKGTGSGSSEGGATGETATQDTDGIGGAVDSEVKVDGVVLGGPAISDTGTSTFDSRNVRMRSDGGGDANSFLRNLPNVQYQNDTDTSAGVTLQDAIDTRPLELSINGARTYENNFILNGVPINNITGTVERSSTELDDTTQLPNADLVYGLHSQTVFVPTEFIDTATIVDSNGSAANAGALGGSVFYDLAAPPTDRYRASVTYSRHTDEMVNWLLATPTGTNPLDRKAPTFEKNNLAVSVGAPITTDLSFIIQASRKTAETEKQKAYKMFDGFVTEDSDNVFLRMATTLKTDIGRFTFDTSHTDYTQHWESYAWRDLVMDVETQSSSSQIKYEGALPAIENKAIGLAGVKLTSRVYYNDSDTGNYTNSNTAYAWVRSRYTSAGVQTFDSTEIDWCRPDTYTSNTICNEGGYGNKEQGQTDLGANAQIRGNIFLGNFLVGAEARSVEGRRARLEDLTYYSAFTTKNVLSSSVGEFTCPDGNEACTSEQYASTKSIWSEFDVSRTVNAYNSYLELDQTLGWFNVRAGVRFEYEDYFKNFNVSPRLVGTITPFSGLSFSGGFNRYYQGETLYYALRDAQPRGQAYTRAYSSTTGEVEDDWVMRAATGNYNYGASDLNTPYKDEYTAALRINDPVLNGNWRLRYSEHYGRDLFSSTGCESGSTSVCRNLTNDGESFYRSASAEYTKFWHNLSTPFFLNALGITTSVTWSEQSTSRSTYIDLDEDEYLNPIYYNGQSYSRGSFVAVTGNLDIPVRIGATLSTNWFDNRLLLDLSAGYNLAYDGVYDTGRTDIPPGESRPHDYWEDTTFKPVLGLDLSGQIAVTEQAAIEFHVNNLLNTEGNKISNNDNPWVRGRSYWVGSTVRF